MLTINEAKCYTKVDKKEFVFTWVISDVMLHWSKQKSSTLTSPAFNIDPNDHRRFELSLIRVYDSRDQTTRERLDVYCVNNNSAELPCKCTISFVQDDDRVGHVQTHYHTFLKYSPVLVFDIPRNRFIGCVSAEGSVTIRCEMTFAIGDRKNSLNYESGVPNEEEAAPIVPRYDFDWVFLGRDLSDVALRTGCGKTIPAHRVVLAAVSPVFKAMFSHELPENKNKSVDIADVTYEAAVEMLRYIYTGNVECQEFSSAAELLEAADKYQLEELKNNFAITIVAHENPNSKIKCPLRDRQIFELALFVFDSRGIKTYVGSARYVDKTVTSTRLVVALKLTLARRHTNNLCKNSKESTVEKSYVQLDFFLGCNTNSQAGKFLFIQVRRMTPSNPGSVSIDNRSYLKKLKSLYQNINWENEEKRVEVLNQLWNLCSKWEGPLPNLRDIFQPKEIDQLLLDSVNAMIENPPARYESMSCKRARFIEFVARCGYNDEPIIGIDGKPIVASHHSSSSPSIRSEEERVTETLDEMNLLKVVCSQ
ncbi:unnamed protein product, partial [Trichogramma brassicae]